MADQYDPVAGAALGALNAAENGINNLQSEVNAPQLPGQSSILSFARSSVQAVAQFSPFNVLAGGGGGGLPGLNNVPGLGNLPGLPGMGQSGDAFTPPTASEVTQSALGGASASQGRSQTRATNGSGESAFD